MAILDITAQDFAKRVTSTASNSIEQAVDALIKDYPVIIVSKSSCPYCAAIKSFLSDSLQVNNLCVLELNALGGGTAAKSIQQHLSSKTGYSTVPQVFVGGTFLGTHDEVMELDGKGLLEEKLKKHVKGPRRNTTSASPGSQGKYQPLFWFPPTVNKWAIRATGLITCGISGTISYTMLQQSDSTVDPSMGLIATVLCADFVLRLTSGSKVAPIAQLGCAVAQAANLTPIPRPGAPKQFASLCGTIFSGLGAAFYLSGKPVVGGVFLAILAACSGMEGGLDFCLGCTFFSIGDSLFGSQPGAKKDV